MAKNKKDSIGDRHTVTSGKYKNDALGTRMKENFEDRTRYKLPRRCYSIIRIDGKSFKSYTKGLIKPFDDALIEDMDATAAYLCKNIMGAKCAYVQSDEISIILTDFETQATEAWFDNNLQKMASISASMATMKFNELRVARGITRLAMFDSRVFQIPQRVEVENYLIWRQQDATRNSIASVAQSLYPHKELMKINSDKQQEMIFQKGINWNDFSSRKKRGGLVIKETYMKGETERTRWVTTDTPIFTKDRTIFSVIPTNEIHVEPVVS
jgi:tRNA(His) guanylyltransferase